jgi:hypothetical protein
MRDWAAGDPPPLKTSSYAKATEDRLEDREIKITIIIMKNWGFGRS